MKTLLNRGLPLLVALLLALGAVGALAATSNGKTVAINEKNFPDEVFRSYVRKFDKNEDGKLDADEIKKVTKIDVAYKEISSLKGVEYFTALKTLLCYDTEITSLDVSKNTKLRKLDVGDNPVIEKLKLGKLADLKWLNICYSDLESVDISGCPKLMKLISQPYFVWEADEMIAWKTSNSTALLMGYDNTLMKGKQVLRKYGKPTSVKFTKSKVTLKPNKSYDLFSYIKLEPASAVYPISFTSSAKSVAKVDEGTLKTTKKKGKTTVTAKVDGKKMSTMKVTTK